MGRGVIAIDADGVLLDYHLGYASAWQRAFGAYPAERDPDAYRSTDRWDVERLTGARLEKFDSVFDEHFWSTIPAVRGALQACKDLANGGFDLVCVTALPPTHQAARVRNLRLHGFPIDSVYATDHTSTDRSPKADTLKALRPLAFVDDYLPYFVGVDTTIHRALILRGKTGSPNTGDLLVHTDSRHGDLAEFAQWWLDQRA